MKQRGIGFCCACFFDGIDKHTRICDRKKQYTAWNFSFRKLQCCWSKIGFDSGRYPPTIFDPMTQCHFVKSRPIYIMHQNNSFDFRRIYIASPLKKALSPPHSTSYNEKEYGMRIYVRKHIIVSWYCILCAIAVFMALAFKLWWCPWSIRLGQRRLPFGISYALVDGLIN